MQRISDNVLQTFFVICLVNSKLINTRDMYQIWTFFNKSICCLADNSIFRAKFLPIYCLTLTIRQVFFNKSNFLSMRQCLVGKRNVLFSTTSLSVRLERRIPFAVVNNIFLINLGQLCVHRYSKLQIPSEMFLLI